MDDNLGRRVIDCAHVTVEYEMHRGRDAVLLVPFPPPADSAEQSVLLTGSFDDLRAVLDGIEGLIYDLEGMSVRADLDTEEGIR